MTRTPDEVDDRPGAYAYYVLLMLFLVLATSLIDRNVLGILLEDIKADLAISDTQLGLLTGLFIGYGLLLAILELEIPSVTP